MDKIPVAACFAAIWYIRFRYDPPGAKADFLYWLFLWFGTSRDSLQNVPERDRNFVNHLARGYCCSRCAFYLGLRCFYTFQIYWCSRYIYRTTLILWRGGREKIIIEKLKRKLKDHEIKGTVPLFDYEDSFSPLKPLLFPCRTSHSRFFPKKHSFSYSYLFVGIPVGWRGSIQDFFSVDMKSLPWSGEPPKDAWYSVDSADYLNRGDSVHGLLGKLEEYLVTQNEKPEDYPHAYLITAPRFLGYSFNPVSFWYLYNEDRELKAMVLEVNNTFDERRMYFLRDSGSDDEEIAQGGANGLNEKAEDSKDVSTTNSERKAAKKFGSTWPKDFHVSPFNSRKGAYSLAAFDPFAPHLNGTGQVNNSITLSSSKGHPKLVARVFSTAESIDPYTINIWDISKFIAVWWWVGFVTFPRIVREAAKLYFRRGLHVWFRPEVLKESIGRNETDSERAIAAVFMEHLKYLVEESNPPTSVKFFPGIATMSTSVTLTHPNLRSASPDTQTPQIVFKVTTPLFYSQIALFANPSTYLASRLANADPKTSTFHTSDPETLTRLFDRYLFATVGAALHRLSALESLRWTLVHLLRSTPAPISRLSRLDKTAITMHKYDPANERAYRRAVLKLLLADYMAFGQTMVIDAILWCIRLWLCWLCVQSLERLLVISRDGWHTSLLEVFSLVLGCTGIHIWRYSRWVL